MSCSIRRIARLGSSFIRNLVISTDFAGRQARGRLVEQQDLRIAGEAEHDLELALLAVRKIANLGVRAVDEAGLLEQLMRLVVDVAIRRQEPPHHEFRRPQAFDRQQHVVEHRQPRKQAGDLERARHAERGAAVALPGRDVVAEQQHLPDARRKYSGDQVEQRGLAGAVRPDDGLAVAGHDLERDAAHGVKAAEALGQPLQFEDGRLAVGCRVGAHVRFLGVMEEGPGLRMRSPGRCCASCRTCRADSRGCRPASPGTRPS